VGCVRGSRLQLFEAVWGGLKLFELFEAAWMRLLSALALAGLAALQLGGLAWSLLAIDREVIFLHASRSNPDEKSGCR
jgi:hypothetical protein